jgi:uncharacterized membrane protein
MTADAKRPSTRMTALTLVIGVGASFLFLAAGLVLALIEPGAARNLEAGQLRDVAAGALRMETASIIHIGVVVLLLTPFARVTVLVWEFFRSREFTFAWISIGVLLLLVASIAFGFAA